MGISLYEKYQAEHAAKPPSLYDTYLASQKPVKSLSKPADANNQATSDEFAAADDMQPRGLGEGAMRALAATGANIAQGIPGMERAQALIGTIGTGDSYDTSLKRLRSFTGALPNGLRQAEKIAGGVSLLGIPGASALSAPVAGAIVGGADQALSADHMSGAERAARTAAGSGIGALLPKVLTGVARPLGNNLRIIGNDARQGVSLPFLPDNIGQPVGDAIRRGASSVGDAAERLGSRGILNRELSGMDRLVKPLGGMVGEGAPAASTLAVRTAARTATSGANYPQALGEGDAAVTAYHAARKDVLDENTRRATDALRVEADNAAKLADQTTAQSRAFVPNRAPTIREALDNFDRVKGEVARRNEGTVDQQVANRALDRRAADAALPSSGQPTPLQTAQPLIPVPPDVHPSVAPLYSDPRIATVVKGLQGLSEFKNVAPDDPRFIDALYKAFSDQKADLGRRVDANIDGGVNLGRYTARDIQQAQHKILNAMDDLGTTYRGAVTEHATQSAWIDAFRRGHDMVTGNGATSKALMKKSPEAFESWLANQHGNPDLQEAAMQGAREAMRGQAANIPLEGGRTAMLSGRPFRTIPKDQLKRDLIGYPEQTRTDIAAQAADDVPRAGLVRKVLSHTPILGRAVDAMPKDRFADAVSSSEGVRLLAQIRANPLAYQDVLQSYTRGHGSLADLLKIGTVGAISGR